MKLIGLLLLGVAGISQSAFAADTSANMQATAEITPSCFLEVDDLNFGDVSLQTYQGSGDVAATTNFRVLCTKNAPVSLSTNNGVNGTASEATYGVDFKVQIVDFFNGVYYEVPANKEQNVINGILDGNVNIDLSAVISGVQNSLNTAGGTNIYGDLITNGFGASGYCDCPNNSFGWRVVTLDGARFNSTSNPIQGSVFESSNMTNGSTQLPYQLSTTAGFAEVLGLTPNNDITYTQNDGQFQTFTLHGRANVDGIEPGVYVDTNTLTIHF